MTKNGHGRVVYLTPELKVLLRAQVARVAALEKTIKQERPVAVPVPCDDPACLPTARGHSAERLSQSMADRVQQGRRSRQAPA
jgi:hypothetical protein